MKNINAHFTNYIRANISIYALIICILIAPATSWAINKAAVEKIKAAEVAKIEPQPEATPPKYKRKKQGRANRTLMNTPLISVPVGTWGTRGMILNVVENSVNIQYDCADGQIEQTLKLDIKGNFAANGFHSGRSPGPTLKDAQSASRGARYEGKISGDTMTLRVTLIETKEVIGEFKLQRGKIPKLTRCY